MSDISTFRTKVLTLIQDDADMLTHTAAGEVDQCIESAVKIYSKDRPLIKAHSFSGSGSYDYALPSDWIQGLSDIKSVEYPSGDQDPNLLRPEDFMVYNNGTAWKFRFLSDTPASSQTVIIMYTTYHTVDSSSSSVYAGDFEAVCFLGASICFDAMASKYTQTSEPIIAADAVNYADKRRQCSEQSTHFYKEYQKALDRGEEAEPSSVIKDFDTDFIWEGSHLTHLKEYR